LLLARVGVKTAQRELGHAGFLPEENTVVGVEGDFGDSRIGELLGRRPDGVRLDLELVEERRFRKGVVVLRYAVRG
jgi:hypothetical protein